MLTDRQKKQVTMMGIYGASPAMIAKALNEDLGKTQAAYQPRRMGLYDRSIGNEKLASIKATCDNDIGFMPLDRRAVHIVTALVREQLVARHDQPSNFRGAQHFRSSGDFTNIAAVGYL